ncbi:MAG: hypothetical protein ABI949_05285, partial [Ilumatobacteraceae bacterium]
SAWNDVHNVVLQMLVTTGIVGIVLLTLFVVWAMRRADFGLSLAVVAIAVNWLLQPSTTSSLMIAAIFLGASAARITAPPVSTGPSRRWLRLVTAGAATLGLLAGMLLVAADLHLRDTVLNGSRADVRSAAAWFGDDPFVVDFFILNSYRTDTAGDRAERHDLALREVAAEPDVPRWWNELAMTQWDLDDLAGMRVSINKALSLQPNHIRSWVQMTAYAKRVGDVHLEEIARAHACELGAPVC